MSHAALQPIDAVITWVNGTDPAHLARRQQRQMQLGGALHANAINPHRWGSSDELTYCLTSIAHHAPWLRHVWLVTDAQTPDLSAVPAQLRERLAIVDHREIFAGYTHVLPTFNSLSIEAMLWRIPGLAESFLYFNDDVFLTAPLHPQDVFSHDKPVLRGKWVDYSALVNDPARQSDPALFNHFTQINAAQLAEFDPAHMWASAHVVHPLRRPLLEALFARHRAAFEASITHPFRDLRQFQPMALHNMAAIRAGHSVHLQTKDYAHLRSGAVIDFPLDQVRAYLHQATTGQNKFLCINDLPQLEASLPESRAWLARATGR
ncbi:MAG: hypothetical protein EA339_05540 [Rhodobacteraceae bacterium]|nr:MAG: hypothetical protein EA339_05540 [Paracoccaceae bacterium]